MALAPGSGLSAQRLYHTDKQQTTTPTLTPIATSSAKSLCTVDAVIALIPRHSVIFQVWVTMVVTLPLVTGMQISCSTTHSLVATSVIDPIRSAPSERSRIADREHLYQGISPEEEFLNPDYEDISDL